MKTQELNSSNATIHIALAGNPNSGKTTIFNKITGFRQHVGNYPGVTVEKKEGEFSIHGLRVLLTDLPGIYSLTAYSEEELVARRHILEEKPDVLIDVVDASNLERNLYLATQFMELGVPMVIALNMSDVARSRGIEFDLEKLSRLLGVRIVPTVGAKGEGVHELVHAAVKMGSRGGEPTPIQVNYGPDIEREIEALRVQVASHNGLGQRFGERWSAIKLLENDPDLIRLVEGTPLAQAAQEAAERVRRMFGDPADIIMADRRYGFISGACSEAVRLTVESRHDLSDRLDDLLTHEVLGIPVLLVLMYAVFWLTFTLGGPPMEWIEWGFTHLGAAVSSLWPEGSDSPLRSLLVDGVIGGVGGVLVFLPNILLLFLGIAMLEDTGYMARAAFIMDRLMHKIGLHGKSFIPLLIGFGCSVPAIMATRTLENKRDRLITMLIAPLMSCGARLPIYALIIPAFFPQAWQAPVLWMIYVTGILLAIASARLLNRTVLRGPSEPFVMELPPYRIPTAKSIAIHMWDRGKSYLKKAGTLILAASVLLWAIAAFPVKKNLAGDYAARSLQAEQSLSGEALESALAQIELERHHEQLSYSLAGRIGRSLEHVLWPLGFDWKISTALIGAFAAKEVFVAQMGIIYAVQEDPTGRETLREDLRRDFSPLAGVCILLFCLIGTPCVATLAVTRKESGSWKWALLQWGGLTLMAYIVTLIVYQTGSLLGLGV